MKIRFDDNLDSYQGFFDHSWVKQLSSLTIGSQIENTTMELVASWKGTSIVRQLPWLMITGLKDATESLLNYHQPIPVQILSILAEKISKGLESNGITLISSERRALIKEIQQIETELVQDLDKNPSIIDKHKLWRQYLDQQEFRLGLWKSEISAYSSIYFAYEYFLIAVIKTLNNLNALHTNQLKREITKLVDNKLTQILWTDNSVEIARLIRHALVHNGGKITQDLERYRDQLFLEDEQIVIMPEQTNHLYNNLKNRVTQLCQVAIQNK